MTLYSGAATAKEWPDPGPQIRSFGFSLMVRHNQGTRVMMEEVRGLV
jgi:hypothetical protein